MTPLIALKEVLVMMTAGIAASGLDGVRVRGNEEATTTLRTNNSIQSVDASEMADGMGRPPTDVVGEGSTIGGLVNIYGSVRQ